jgi:hypothetical protein
MGHHRTSVQRGRPSGQQVKDRKSNRPHRSLYCREPLIKALLSVGRDKMAGSEGPFRAWEGVRQGDFLAKIRRISPSGQQRARQAPGGCSPRYALIEIVLWLRRSNGIARNALFIEKDEPGLLVLPGWGSARRGDRRWRSGLADLP